MQRRAFVFGAGALALAGCGAPVREHVFTDEQVTRAMYRHAGPTRLTLFTLVNNRSGSGAHTSLMINAPSQRVIFDPAGSVRHENLVERGDVIFGVTPQIENVYVRAHARVTYHAWILSRDVPPEVAEKALQLALAAGPQPQGACSTSTGKILQQLPGFESIRPAVFPSKLAEQFAALPNVTERKIYENDADDKGEAIAKFDEQLGG